MAKKKTEEEIDVSKDVKNDDGDDAAQSSGLSKGKGSQEKVNLSRRFNKSNALLIVGGLIFGLIIGLAITSPQITGAAISEGDVGATMTELFPQIEIANVRDIGSVYMVSFTANGQQGSFYVTKDGGYALIGQAIDLKEMAEQDKQPVESTGRAAETVNVPKTDKPEVEVFVMSYCPYGLQMEKAVLPVQELLGSQADISVKFVHYLMHGKKEAEENVREYCIQKEEPGKFWDYLECFIRDGEGKENACMLSTGIAPKPIAACVIAAKKEFGVDADLAGGEQFPRFGIDAEASNGYGVRGSPALVINGQLVEASRTPEGIKAAVCDAFTEAPAECETQLSQASPGPGFGLEAAAAGADSSATCG